MGQETTNKFDKNHPTADEKSNKGFKSYLKTLGVAGFLFFLIKGLIWLAIFWGIGKSC
ncbi:MAG TPA: hypothetical protein PLQ57_15920 [Saprospiraceae bacterium]|nr:hypothetical protein [Saprospiraceae bacterium]HRG22528.1 hypothetical protein [Saprospiraceae bacterium]